MKRSESGCIKKKKSDLGCFRLQCERSLGLMWICSTQWWWHVWNESVKSITQSRKEGGKIKVVMLLLNLEHLYCKSTHLSSLHPLPPANHLPPQASPPPSWQEHSTLQLISVLWGGLNHWGRGRVEGWGVVASREERCSETGKGWHLPPLVILQSCLSMGCSLFKVHGRFLISWKQRHQKTNGYTSRLFVLVREVLCCSSLCQLEVLNSVWLWFYSDIWSMWDLHQNFFLLDSQFYISDLIRTWMCFWWAAGSFWSIRSAGI